MSRLSQFKSVLRSLVAFPVYVGKFCHVEMDRYINDIKEQERRLGEKRLVPYGFQVFSENDEDGIIEEIFARIGETNRRFVEFGAGNGKFSNSLYLLHKGWKGLWIEGSGQNCDAIRRMHHRFTAPGKLNLLNSFVTDENIESLMKANDVPEELDMLSIDIDGNDYHVWKSILKFRPRLVVVEYNSKLRACIECVQDYDPGSRWQGVNYFGASLKSFQLLGEEKGYGLVGCNITGANAFFVRKDLLEDKFAGPFTSENHFQPPRYFLRRTVGLPSGFRPS